MKKQIPISRRFEQRGDTLFAGNVDGTPFDVALAPLGSRRFALGRLVTEFGGPEGKPAEWLRLLQRGATVDSMVRVPRWNPAVAALRAIAGDYWSDELAVGYSLVLKDSTLWLNRPKAAETGLRPLFEDVFFALGTGIVRVVRTGGRVSGLAVTGAGASNVSFLRWPPRPGSP